MIAKKQWSGKVVVLKIYECQLLRDWKGDGNEEQA
jgi:hypothetical protein